MLCEDPSGSVRIMSCRKGGFLELVTVVSWELVECKFWGPTQELLRQGVSRESVLVLRNADIFSLLMYTFSSLGCLLYSISIPPYKMSWVESVRFKLALVERATHFQHRPFINLGEGTLSAVPPGSAPPQPSTGFYAANKDVRFPALSKTLQCAHHRPLASLARPSLSL